MGKRPEELSQPAAWSYKLKLKCFQWKGQGEGCIINHTLHVYDKIFKNIPGVTGQGM